MSLLISNIIIACLLIGGYLWMDYKNIKKFHLTVGILAQIVLVTTAMECYRQSVDWSYSFIIVLGIVFAAITQGLLLVAKQKGKKGIRFLKIANIFSLVCNGIYIAALVRNNIDLIILPVPISTILTIIILWIVLPDLKLEKGKKKSECVAIFAYIFMFTTVMIAWMNTANEKYLLMVVFGAILSVVGYLFALFTLLNNRDNKIITMAMNVCLYVGQLFIACSMLMIH